MDKVTTGCCALCQIQHVGNRTPVSDLKRAIARLKKEKLRNTEVGVSRGNGQTAVFIIACPDEDILKKNLLSLGFELKHKFERRVGYPKTGLLEMYILNL